MRTRDLSILSGILLLGVFAGIVVLSQGDYGGELAPPPAPAAAHAPDAAPPPSPEPLEGSATAAPLVAADASSGGRSTDVAGWTKGIVKGDIQLAVSVLDRLTSITVVVEEARNEVGPGNTFRRRNRLVVPVQMGRGTPTFEVTDIPFSQYPYVVSVYAPGLNGSRRTVTIDDKTPLIDDIVLSITPGAPFSVLVRDQDAAPYVGLDVLMMPAGEPGGRPNHQAATDNFGSIVFEDVLAGDYQVFISLGGQSVVPAQTITVQPGLAYATSRVRGQQAALTVPRGVPVQLQVHDRLGYGIADAALTATATDRIKLTEIKTTTNAAGRADFTHLAPGTWQVTIEKQGFQRADLQLTLRAGQEPLYREVPLAVRIR